MAKEVWKFYVRIDDRVTIRMPAGAELLTVAVQHGGVYLWARVDPCETGVDREFRVAGTGHPDADGAYVGTVLLHDGARVFHVFDLGEAQP